MPKAFFSLPSEVFHSSWSARSVLQKVFERQVGVFDQVCAVFSATGPRLVWATLSPVCTHNVQWSSMFAATMVLNVPSSSCVAASCASHLNHRYTGTLQLQDQGRHWHCKCTTLRPKHSLLTSKALNVSLPSGRGTRTSNSG